MFEFIFKTNKGDYISIWLKNNQFEINYSGHPKLQTKSFVEAVGFIKKEFGSSSLYMLDDDKKLKSFKLVKIGDTPKVLKNFRLRNKKYGIDIFEDNKKVILALYTGVYGAKIGGESYSTGRLLTQK